MDNILRVSCTHVDRHGEENSFNSFPVVFMSGLCVENVWVYHGVRKAKFEILD